MTTWNGAVSSTDPSIVRRKSPVVSQADRVTNPVLTSDDVTDCENPTGAADPFVVHDGDRYHMFFEVIIDDPGDDDTLAEKIGHAVSDNGHSWRYDSIVLDVEGHLAYPYVFCWNDDWYMTPDSGLEGLFRVFRARSFPSEWEQIATPIERDGLVDPSPFRYHGHWYMICGVAPVGDGRDYTLCLYHADELTGEWIEHRGSPIATGNRIARPGGRPIRHEEHVDVFFQDCRRTYGDKVRAYRISELTSDGYALEEYPTSPIVEASFRDEWNYDGMHHVDFGLAYTGISDIIAMDGKATGWNQRFSIGLGKF